MREMRRMSIRECISYYDIESMAIAGFGLIGAITIAALMLEKNPSVENKREQPSSKIESSVNYNTNNTIYTNFDYSTKSFR